MTRDELIESIAELVDKFDERFDMPEDAAELIIAHIFDALKEPTEEMNDAARHLMLWQDGYNRPTYKNLKTHCRILGKTAPDDCEDIDHVPPKSQRTSWIYQTMLAASPLAPEGKK